MVSLSSDFQPVAITGIGPMCRAATSVEELKTLERAERMTNATLEETWFDPAHHLGERKFKYLTNATRYGLAATRMALVDARIDDETYPREQRGVILGTNFGVSAVHAAMDDVVLRDGALALSPMEAPNFSVNLAASQISVRYGFRAFNICLTSSMVAGIEAVIFAAQAVRRGRCSMAIAGATEDRPPASVADVLGYPPETGAACAIVLERLHRGQERGVKPYAVVQAGSLWFTDPASLETAGGQERLAGEVRKHLDRVLAPNQRSVCYCSMDMPTPLNRAVTDAVIKELARRSVQYFVAGYPGAAGTFLTVSPVLQLAAAAVHSPKCLVVATSPEGHVAMLTLESPGQRPDEEDSTCL